MEKTKFYITTGLQRFLIEQNSTVLMRAIVKLQELEVIKREEFQVWRIKRKHKSKFTIVLDDGNYNKIFWSTIELPGCNANKMKFYFENSVLCFPRER